MRAGAEELTLEIWVKLNSYAGRDHADEGPNNPGWILGHDNGGYDRAICLHDQRYGGIAGPNGGVYSSTLGFPEIGEWTHIVATFANGADCPVYRNDAHHQLTDSRVVNNGDGDESFSVGGLENYGEFARLQRMFSRWAAFSHRCCVATANHHVDAYIAEVRTYDVVLGADAVRERYLSTCERYNACPQTAIGTADACTAPASVSGLVFALDAACQDWAASVHPDTANHWYSLAGDTSIGVSTDGLQYDSQEGKGSFLFDNIVTTAEIDISPSVYPALTLELWVRVNSFAGTSNGWILGHDNSGESLTALFALESTSGPSHRRERG